MDFDILDLLSQLVSPQEAEAAGPRRQAPATPTAPPAQAAPFNPATDPITQRLLLSALLKQQQQQADPLYQAKVKAAEAKAAPPQGLKEILGGGQPSAQPVEAPIWRGTTPDTGTPYFTNYAGGLPAWAPPEAKTMFEKAAPPAQAQPAGAMGGQLDPQAIEKLGAFNTWAEHNKVPSKIRAQMSDMLFPWAKETKTITPEQAGKMFKYDPATMGWSPLQPEDYDKPLMDLMKQGYRITTQQQQDSAKALPAMVQSFANLKDSYGKISKQGFAKRVGGEIPGVGSYINPEATDYLKSAQQFTTFFDAEVMGKRGAGSPQMQQLRAKVLPQLTTNPEIGKKLLGDFEQLMGVIKDNQVRMYSGQAPDLQKEEKVAEAINKKAGVSETQITSGRVPLINPQGKPVTLPAEQVSEALKSGYKPYQQ